MLNGFFDMLVGVVDSVRIGDVFDDVLSVESVGIFKLDVLVYELVINCFGCVCDEVFFVFLNGWDVVGVVGFGFIIVWVNCVGELMDCLLWILYYVLFDFIIILDLVRV